MQPMRPDVAVFLKDLTNRWPEIDRIIPGEALIKLRRRLDTLPLRHPERTTVLQNVADLYGASRATLYRPRLVLIAPNTQDVEREFSHALGIDWLKMAA